MPRARLTVESAAVHRRSRPAGSRASPPSLFPRDRRSVRRLDGLFAVTVAPDPERTAHDTEQRLDVCRISAILDQEPVLRRTRISNQPRKRRTEFPDGQHRVLAARPAVAGDDQYSRTAGSIGRAEIERRSLDQAKLGVAAADHSVAFQLGCKVGIARFTGFEIQHPMLMGTRTDPVIEQGRGYRGAEIGFLWLVTIEDRCDRVGVGMIPGADALA